MTQPFASVTVMTYVPSPKPLAVESVEPLDHKKVYGVVPPVVETTTDPSDALKQLIS